MKKPSKSRTFDYDGLQPGTYFWVGEGTPSDKGSKVPDEHDFTWHLHEYSGQTIEITLPGDIKVYDIDFLSIWCKLCAHNEIPQNFAHVEIPEDLNVPAREDEPSEDEPVRSLPLTTFATTTQSAKKSITKAKVLTKFPHFARVSYFLSKSK